MSPKPEGDADTPRDKRVPLQELARTEPEEFQDPTQPPSVQDRNNKATKKTRASTLEKANLKTVELQNREVEDRLERNKADHKQLFWLRWFLGLAGLGVVIWWQCRILEIVALQGKGDLKLEKEVSLALITTTTANVFGFLVIVMKFVFPSKPAQEGESQNHSSKQQE